MFAKLGAEKMSADNYHAIKKKEQKQVMTFTKFDLKKENIDY